MTCLYQLQLWQELGLSTLVPCELTIPATAKVVIDITAQSPSPMSCCLENLSFGLIIDIGIEHGLEYRFIYFEVSKFLFCLIIFASLIDYLCLIWKHITQYSISY